MREARAGVGDNRKDASGSMTRRSGMRSWQAAGVWMVSGILRHYIKAEEVFIVSVEDLATSSTLVYNGRSIYSFS